MSGSSDAVETGMSVIGDCLVVSVQSEVQTATLTRMQNDILDRIQTTTIRSTILDLSTVSVLDSLTFKILADTARMCSLLGVASIFVEFQPAVVSALVDLDADIGGIRTARTLEDGLRLLQVGRAEEQASDDADEAPHDDSPNGDFTAHAADSDAEGSDSDDELA
jgi:rsbT antagonist protein RsbS